MKIESIPELFTYAIGEDKMIPIYNLCTMYNIKTEMLYDLLQLKKINIANKNFIDASMHSVKLEELPEDFSYMVEKFKEAGRSEGEDLMYRFVKSLGVNTIPNDRNAISPKELDIYVPEHYFAIEYDGLHWHKESSLVEKTNLCDKKGIRLIRFYEDEWQNKKLICKGLIKSALNIYDEEIKLSECEAKIVDDSQYHQFIKNNHIHGYAESLYKVGLFHKGLLVYAIGIKEWEGHFILNRICPKLNIHVNGALKKLLLFIHKEHKEIKEIYTYADRRTSNIKFYKYYGFKLMKTMPCEYFYIVRGERLGKFDIDRVEKLLKKKYDPNLSEEENLHNNGYDRIFDCGSYKMRYTF